MSTSTESYTAVASQARQITDQSVEVWKRGAKTVADQATVIAQLPTVDITEPVERYFEYVQMSVDLNRSLVTRWAELFTTMTGAVKEQAHKVGTIVAEQTDTVASLATDQAAKAEQVAREQAAKAEQVAREQAAQAEEAEKEQARKAKQQERDEAKAAHDEAKARYEDLTKAELTDLLAERGLPKSGNVDELVERLVAADSE